MFDRDELDQIRRKAPGAIKSGGDGTDLRVFATSLFLSVAFLAFVIWIVASLSGVGALSVGGVGGFVLEADSMIGNDLSIYPYPTETAACKANFTDSTGQVVSEGEVALPALRADIGQLRVPSTDSLEIIKDIRVPEITGISTVRLRLNRSETATNPSYPPSASPGPASVGDNPNTNVGSFEFAGIQTFTKNDGGYADVTFQRTRNITDGESVPINVTARGSYDYSFASIDPYPPAEGRNPDRYVSGVSAQGLSNLGNGEDGGYADYTAVGTTNNATRGGSISVEVNAVGADPDYSEPDMTEYPDGSGNSNSETYITSFDMFGISVSDNFDYGYIDRTYSNTDNITKSSSPNVYVGVQGTGHPDAPRKGATGANQGSSHSFSCGLFCSNDDQTYINQVSVGDSYAFTGDNGGGLDATDVTTYGGANVSASTATVEVEYVNPQYDNENSGSTNYIRLWIDWDGDGYESSEAYDVCAQCPTGNPATESVTFEVPDVGPGTYPMQVTHADMGQSGSSGYPSATTSDFSGEIEDYTFGIPDPIKVEVYGDLNQNFALGDMDFGYEEAWEDGGTTINTIGKSDPVTETVSTSWYFPSYTKSGSTLLRAVARQGGARPSPTGTNFRGEIEDYTAHVQTSAQNSTVKAFIDWDQDGTFQNDEEYTIGTQDYPNNVGVFTVSDNIVGVNSDAKAGTTLMRIVHQQEHSTFDDYPDPGPGESTIDGEYEDYTVHVEPDQSYVRAWVDWNQDGNFNDANEGPYEFGGSVGFPNNNGEFEVTDTINAPSPVGTGARLLRVTHKQGLSAPVPAEGDGGWEGETEDYTVLVGPEGDISQSGNITVGDASLVLSDLTAENITLSGDTTLDEDYSDNTFANPTFGSDGALILAGQDARIENVSGLVHQVNLNLFEVPSLGLRVDYDPPNPRNKTENACGPLPY